MATGTGCRHKTCSKRSEWTQVRSKAQSACIPHHVTEINNFVFDAVATMSTMTAEHDHDDAAKQVNAPKPSKNGPKQSKNNQKHFKSLTKLKQHSLEKGFLRGWSLWRLLKNE